METNKRLKLKEKTPIAFSKLVKCFLFIGDKVITKDNLFEIVDYHLFNKGIAVYYCDVRNKNNDNVIGFTAFILDKLSPKQILNEFSKGVFYDSTKN